MDEDRPGRREPEVGLDLLEATPDERRTPVERPTARDLAEFNKQMAQHTMQLQLHSVSLEKSAAAVDNNTRMLAAQQQKTDTILHLVTELSNDKVRVHSRLDKLDQRLDAMDHSNRLVAARLDDLRSAIERFLDRGVMPGRVAPSAIARVQSAIESARTAPAVVLVVEDDLQVAKVYERVFSPLAFTLIAHHASEARLFIQELGARIDLCVLDLLLPDGRGEDLLRDLRQVSGGHLVHVVVISGLDDVGTRDRVKAINAGRGALEFRDKTEVTAIAELIPRRSDLHGNGGNADDETEPQVD